MLGKGGLRTKLAWSALLVAVGLLGVLLPVALASTGHRAAGTRGARSTLVRDTAADDVTSTGPTTVQDGTTITVSGDQINEVVGQYANVDFAKGTVLVKVPGSDSFVSFLSLTDLPVGSTINATNGLIELTFAMPDGTTQTATFWKGEFTLGQSSTGAVSASLAGGSFTRCPAPSKLHSKLHAASAATAKSKKPGTKVRSLWANAKGSFTTSGKSGAAAVLGTEWLTIDQCDGTWFYVKKASSDPNGRIRVTVLFPHRHTVLLKRGHFLLAPARGY